MRPHRASRLDDPDRDVCDGCRDRDTCTGCRGTRDGCAARQRAGYGRCCRRCSHPDPDFFGGATPDNGSRYGAYIPGLRSPVFQEPAREGTNHDA